MFYKTGVLKNFPKATENIWNGVSVLIKLQASILVALYNVYVYVYIYIYIYTYMYIYSYK